ncbi:thiamine-phosphate kinase [Gallaecimonas pentaromativorans]|uniref:Thiamine-monophosphate kinase n=1 Tax=Gallaecimonas pentaromativorans TaxID=584787 RepID=A0A3N1NSF9_9GAMM|nr:thiamine-phosphate kinase [Gallaecimonas pentaromativorans]ROQ18839.1 thiamine-phosphate kinase [Gallaecimonas pentaromativorans]
MASREFALIDTYFKGKGHQRKDVVLGIGDDCALLAVSDSTLLAVTTDTLVAGVHFPLDTPARAVGHKAVAVNLSDLAAMGAEAAWVSLALTLPDADDAWLAEFASAVVEVCDYYGVTLVGGDTTRGPLSVTITAQGKIPAGKQLTRSGAKPGDWLYVTGTLGDAALGLALVQGREQASSDHHEFLVGRLNYPTPRLLAGQALRGVASSAIDISDGLASDLGHILSASHCGANLFLDKLPLSQALLGTMALESAWQLALGGGDDYELLFTVPEAQKGALDTALAHCGVKHSCVGQLRGGEGISYLNHGQTVELDVRGYEHCWS